MLNEKTCACCTKSLAHRRPQTRTCSANCRLKLHRMNKTRPVSVKLSLSKIQFNILKEEADNLGLKINALVISRATQPRSTIGAQQ